MRIYNFPAILMLLQLLSQDILAGIVKSGETIAIRKPIAENVYLAGENINTEAVVKGDLISIGNVVSVGDTVFDDVAIAANEIQIKGDVEGDARLFGSIVKITKNINGDLIIFGGTVHIEKHVVIAGDLRVFCREAVIHGTINGDVHVIGKKIEFNGAAYGTAIFKAENLLINGTVEGPSKLAAKSILLRQNTRFHDDVEYWQKENNLDLSPYVEEERAIYNEDLKIGFCEFDWHCFGLGIFTFALLYALTIIFTITTLVLLFHSNLWKVGVRINESYLKNFGIGALYFVGLPLVTLFLFVIIVGIPLALVFGSIYFLSLLFAFTVSSVILAEGINFRYQKGWGKSKLILVAMLIFIGLKVIAAIPFIGLMAVMVLIGMVYGAVIYLLMPKFKLPFLNTSQG